MIDLIFPDNKEFDKLWNLQTDAKRWKLYSDDECDKLKDIIEYLKPLTIVDWGCGLARTSICLFKTFNLVDTQWFLCDLTGSDVGKWVNEDGRKKKGGMGTFKHSDTLPYNDLSLTKEFCTNNGLSNIEIKDVNETTDLGSPDLFYSMHCVGYHFSIKSLLDKLSVTPKVMIFGIRIDKKNFYDVVDVDSIEGYSKRIIKGNYLQNYLVFEKV